MLTTIVENMALGKIILSMSVVAVLIYTQTDFSVLFRSTVKGLFCLACVTWLIQYIDWSRLSQWRSSKAAEENNLDYEEIKQKENDAREIIQGSHNEKALSYKERILQPREDAKKKKKKEEHYKFLGPEWKGEGHQLGGEVHSDNGTPVAAADHRVLPDNVNEDVLNAAREEMRKRQQVKKKIELPPEPADGADDCVLVVLRTPIGQIQQRKFSDTDKFQTILDFMTTLGFHQRCHTLCTSYPRMQLTDKRESTLAELGFKRKVTLNIEELD